MKPINLYQLTRIIGGKIIRGKSDSVIRAANYGKTKYVHRRQVYFFSKKTSLTKQYDAVKRAKPIAVVIPPRYRRLSFPHETTVIETTDPYQAFWRLGLWNFRQIPVNTIGITGSAGKSTTTAMVASILKRRYRLVKTEGNLNTVSFLPSYLCRLSPGDHVLLLEMGMKSRGNIARQCRVVRPKFGAITNVGEAHLGSLGSAENILKAKQELIDGMRDGGVVWLNADNTRSRRLRTDHRKVKRYWFGVERPAHVQATHIRYTARGMSFRVNLNNTSYTFTIPTYGVHNVYNALTAIGLCYSMGLSISDIQTGLATFKPPHMRQELIRGKNGTLLINDAWNANPTAMKAGLRVLLDIAGRRKSIAVLGDMKELGSYTRQAHVEVGNHIARYPVDQLVTVGRHAYTIAQQAIKKGFDKRNVFCYGTREAALRHLFRVPPGCVIYFKASRSLHFERIVKALRATKTS